jgi:hypothetical protein
MNGNEPAVVLATKAIPRLPVFNRPLSDVSVLIPLERIAPNSVTMWFESLTGAFRNLRLQAIGFLWG